jgi:outer membrane protein assembly factor BamB
VGPLVLTDNSAIASRQEFRVLHLARLILALVITPAILIHSWGWSLVVGLIEGRPEPLFVGMLCAGIGLVMALTAGVSERLKSRPIDWFVLCGMPATWSLLVAGAFALYVGPSLPKFVIVPAFVMASLWVPWCAWIFYRPWPWKRRITGLVACEILALAFILAFRVNGVAGEFQVDFIWRSAPVVDPGAELPTRLSPSSADLPDLTKTTADDYPQFLGPNRTGIIKGPGLLQDWTTIPHREVWRKPVGAAWSAFAVVGNFAITQEQRGEDECVVCYRLSDGAVEWVHADKARFESGMGGIGPRATPTIADGKVYTVGATGILNCLDGTTGKALWTVDILADTGGHSIAHGVCGSPLVTSDWVIVSPTGINNASLAAYHRQDGKRIWLGGRLQASYGSPALAELAGSKQVLITNFEGIEGSDLQTGKPLWSYAWTGETRVNCSQPIIIDASAGRVLFCTGYGKGSVLFDVAPAGSGTFGVNPIWFSPGKMCTKFTTAVMYEGFVYGLDEGILACLDIKTGQQIWKAGRYQHGQILLAGDLLIVQAEGGEVFLVRPDPSGLRETGKIAALSGKTWNNPVLAGRRLLVRNNHEAVCIELPLREGR